MLSFFFFNDTATTEIYTLSLHDALPIFGFGKTEVAIRAAFKAVDNGKQVAVLVPTTILAFQHYKTFSERLSEDRKSTRLNSSHVRISYAVFCLKKKKKNSI